MSLIFIYGSALSKKKEGKGVLRIMYTDNFQIRIEQKLKKIQWGEGDEVLDYEVVGKRRASLGFQASIISSLMLTENTLSNLTSESTIPRVATN